MFNMTTALQVVFSWQITVLFAGKAYAALFVAVCTFKRTNLYYVNFTIPCKRQLINLRVYESRHEISNNEAI